MIPDLIKTALLNAREKGFLAPVCDRGYDFDFTRSWNAFVKNDEKTPGWVLDDLGDKLSEVVYMTVIAAKGEDLKSIALKTITNNLLKGDVFSASTMSRIETPLHRGRYGVRLVNWKPEFYHQDAPDKALPDPVKSPVNNGTVTFRSPTVYAADWIRIKGLREMVEDTKFEINYAEQRIRRTLHNLEKHNFIEVAAADAGGGIYQDGTTLLIGSQHYDEDTGDDVDPGLPEIGHIITDYWGYTLIDHVTLTDILTKNGGNAEDLIQEWLDGPWSMGINVLTLEPGPYKVTWLEDEMTEPYTEALETYKPLPGHLVTRAVIEKI